MATSLQPGNYTRLTGTTTETVISAKPCILLAIVPNNTTAGTVTLRDQATAAGGTTYIAQHAIGATQSDLQYGPYGVVCQNGLTVQNSSASDAVTVVWMPL